MKIYKYRLEPKTGEQFVAMPPGRVISFGSQSGELVFWAEVDEKSPNQSTYFYLAFTGDDLPKNTKVNHVGTVQIGSLVWHLYK